MKEVFQYVVSQSDLSLCIANLSTKKQIAVDLEFDKNRFRYGFNLCLVQVFDGEIAYIIDPLEKLDLQHLFKIFENEIIQKVVFSFDEDLRLLHSLGCFPKNVYDVHIAARLLNYSSISHTNLVKDVLGIEPVSSAQNSNWFVRPLTLNQLNYAANDVYHLFKLQIELEKRAKEIGVLEWILEENNVIDSLDYSNEPSIVYKKEVDKKGLTEFQWHIFENLLDFRESIAERNNKPSYQVISKEDLKELVLIPNKINQWKQLKGVLRSIQTDVFLKELKALILTLNQEAESLQLSSTRKAVINIENGTIGGISKSQKEKIKTEIYTPLKDKIAFKFGENTAAFILPNRLVSELIEGNTDRLLGYKKKLFQSLN